MSSPPDPAGGRRPTGLFRNSRLASALAYPDIRMLWVATLSAMAGQGMQHVLLAWLVFDMTDSSAMVGVMYAVRSSPNLVVGFLAGSVADRLDRRSLQRIANSGMAFVSFAMAMLLLNDRLEVWHLMVGTFIFGTFQAFNLTSRQAYIYDVVGARRVTSGVAVITLAHRIGGFLGAVLAGALLLWIGPGSSFVVKSVCYALAVIFLYGLRHRGEAAPETREPILQNPVSYYRELKTNKAMASLMVSTAAAEALGFSHQTMFPVLARDVLNVGPAGLGALTAFRFLGGALGVFVVTVTEEIRRRGLLLLSIVVLLGVGVALLSQAPNLWMALVFVTFVNAMASAADILHNILMQLSVPNELRGRAIGSWLVGTGTAPVGHIEIGYLAVATTARVALLTNGIALVVMAIGLGIFLPRLRRL